MEIEEWVHLLPKPVVGYIRQIESYVKQRSPDYKQPNFKTKNDLMGWHHNKNGERVFWKTDGVSEDDFKVFIREQA